MSNEQIYTDFITGKSGGTSEILIDDISSLFENLLFFLRNFPFNFFFGIGAYTPEDPGIYFLLKSVNELHFLLDMFYTLGLCGFIIFWNIFFISLRSFKKYKNSNKNKNISNYDDIKSSFFYITILFICSNIHYSPIGLTSIYIVFLIILIPIQIQNGLLF